jgi:PqqD family protein of HPr-rel-A system
VGEISIYTADPSEGFRAVDFEGMTALFHRRSGVTHVVAEPVPEILAVLGGKRLTCDALLEALDVDADEESRAALTARLDEMEEAGLVSRA